MSTLAISIFLRHGFSDITGKLLENRNERLINAENNQKRTALHLACMEGHHAATAVLVTDSAIQRWGTGSKKEVFSSLYIVLP